MQLSLGCKSAKWKSRRPSMNLRALTSALAALLIVGVFVVGLAAGKAWGRRTAVVAAQVEQRERERTLEEELVALQQRLERHAQVQHQLAEQALDCRIATTDRFGGRRVELALTRAVP